MKKTTAALAQLILLMLLPLLQSTAQEANFRTLTNAGSVVEVFSRLDPVVINRIHSWEILIRDKDGDPISGAEISVVGGMPDHDHGLPTLPVITGEMQAGRYLLEGVRFHMPGRWELSVTITGPQGNETALLEFEL